MKSALGLGWLWTVANMSRCGHMRVFQDSIWQNE